MLLGHGEAEQELLAAYRGSRLHHAWLITGPMGIGKATLAYRFARFILAHPDRANAALCRTLHVAPDHPAAQRLAAGSHGNILALRRGRQATGDRLQQVIPVEQVRRLIAFFGETAAERGMRICIVDSVDEMAAAGANAMLKLLEEPPKEALFLLISHRPGGLLPTIRSRCRTLRLAPLSTDDVIKGLASFADVEVPEGEIGRIAALSDGSLRRALEIATGGHAAFAALVDGALSSLPDVPPTALHQIGDVLARRDDDTLSIFAERVRHHLTSELSRRVGEHARLLAPLAEVWEKTERALAEVRAYNLDRKSFAFQVIGWLCEPGRRGR